MDGWERSATGKAAVKNDPFRATLSLTPRLHGRSPHGDKTGGLSYPQEGERPSRGTLAPAGVFSFWLNVASLTP